MATADVIILFVTLIVFFVGLPYPKTVVDITSLLFVLLSEAALFCGTALVGSVVKNKVFITAGVTTSLVLYWLITVLAALLFKPVFGSHTGGLIAVMVVVAALALLAVIAILLSGNRLPDDQGNAQDEDIMQSCQDSVFNLLNDEDFKAYSGKLRELYEAFKFSDKTASLPFKETEISNQIEYLAGIGKQTNEEEFSGLVNQILALIKQRNQLVLQSKKGSF